MAHDNANKSSTASCSCKLLDIIYIRHMELHYLVIHQLQSKSVGVLRIQTVTIYSISTPTISLSKVQTFIGGVSTLQLSEVHDNKICARQLGCTAMTLSC